MGAYLPPTFLLWLMELLQISSQLPLASGKEIISPFLVHPHHGFSQPVTSKRREKIYSQSSSMVRKFLCFASLVRRFNSLNNFWMVIWCFGLFTGPSKLNGRKAHGDLVEPRANLSSPKWRWMSNRQLANAVFGCFAWGNPISKVFENTVIERCLKKLPFEKQNTYPWRKNHNT